MERDYKLKVNKFIIGLSIFYFLIFIKTYDAEMTIYNTSLLAFSYKYGFIPRAFIGSIYNLLDVILPVDMYTYAMAMRFIEIVTALFFAIMILIARKTLLMIDRKYFEPVGVLWIIYGVLFVSMFSTKYNFGRVDLFMMLIDAIGIYLLLNRRAEWLIIPLSIIGVLIHEGFVFMYLGVLLVALFYRCLMSDKKTKYGLILGLSFVGASIAFLLIHFVRNPVDVDTYLAIYREGRKLSNIDMPHVSLLSAELLCVNLADIEKTFHKENIIQLPIFICMIVPYLLFAFGFVKNMFNKAEDIAGKLTSLAIALGWMTLLANYLLKVDYGRWVFATFNYCIMILIMMIGEGNEIVEYSLDIEVSKIKKHPGLASLMMIYPIISVPFWDVYINESLKRMSDFINMYLHWY